MNHFSKLAALPARGKLALVILAMAAGASAGATNGQPGLKYRYTIEADRSNVRFVNPVALFFDPKRGELHVADAATSIVTTFASGQSPVARFYHRQKGETENGQPAGLAVDSKGSIFVSDALVDRVFIYDYRGQPSGSIAMPPVGGDRSIPGKMAVDGAGNLYVAVRNAGAICVFDSSGTFQRRVDGSAFGVAECCDVAADDAGNVWMLSPKGQAIHVFDKQGKHLRQFGSHGAGKAAFARPSAVDVDGGGRIWISDIVAHTLKVFSADGTFVAEFGGFGGGNGEFFSPTDLCIDRSAHTLYVLEKSGLRIQAFEIEEMPGRRSDKNGTP